LYGYFIKAGQNKQERAEKQQIKYRNFGTFYFGNWAFHIDFYEYYMLLFERKQKHIFPARRFPPCGVHI